MTSSRSPVPRCRAPDPGPVAPAARRVDDDEPFAIGHRVPLADVPLGRAPEPRAVHADDERRRPARGRSSPGHGAGTPASRPRRRWSRCCDSGRSRRRPRSGPAPPAGRGAPAPRRGRASAADRAESRSPVPVPRERQRRRGESRERDGQDRDEREHVARDERRVDEPHEQTVESEHGEHQQAAPVTSARSLSSRPSYRRVAIHAAADILRQTRTARIQTSAVPQRRQHVPSRRSSRRPARPRRGATG